MAVGRFRNLRARNSCSPPESTLCNKGVAARSQSRHWTAICQNRSWSSETICAPERSSGTFALVQMPAARSSLESQHRASRRIRRPVWDRDPLRLKILLVELRWPASRPFHRHVVSTRLPVSPIRPDSCRGNNKGRRRPSVYPSPPRRAHHEKIWQGSDTKTYLVLRAEDGLTSKFNLHGLMESGAAAVRL
jgi:hypothetical protein